MICALPTICITIIFLPEIDTGISSSLRETIQHATACKTDWLL